MQCVSGMAINHFQPGRGPSPPAISYFPWHAKASGFAWYRLFYLVGSALRTLPTLQQCGVGFFISGVAMFKTLAIGALIWLGTSAAAIALLVLQAVLDAT